MGLDLEMCAIPRQFENILLKWRPNPEYAEWISFTQRILRKENFQTFNDPILEQFEQNVLALKDFYEYTDDDFFFEKGRESATLDYIFDRFVEDFGLDFPSHILWNGGERYENCISGQGVTIRIYKQTHIENINSLFQILSEDDILRKYDFEEMSETGVYKLTHPDDKYILAESFSNLKILFQRALLNDAYILRNIY